MSKTPATKTAKAVRDNYSTDMRWAVVTKPEGTLARCASQEAAEMIAAALNKWWAA